MDTKVGGGGGGPAWAGSSAFGMGVCVSAAPSDPSGALCVQGGSPHPHPSPLWVQWASRDWGHLHLLSVPWLALRLVYVHPVLHLPRGAEVGP